MFVFPNSSLTSENSDLGNESSLALDINSSLSSQAAAGGLCRTIKIYIISVLGALIILGNMAVVFVIASSVTSWSKNTKYILISLAGVDSALALVVVPLNLYGSVVMDFKPESARYCHVVAFFNSTIFASSIYSLATVSLERYVAVFFPLRYGVVMTKSRIKLLIAAAWLLPPVFLFPIAIPGGIMKVHFSRASLICNPDYSSNVLYSLLLTALIFFPCSAIVTFVNLRLWFAARSQRKKLKSRAGYVGRSGPDLASRVLVPVVIVFYICWTPCIVTIFYNAIAQEMVPEWVEFVALWLPSGNGFLNCIVYFWINRSFRRGCQQLGCRLCCCWRQCMARPGLPAHGVPLKTYTVPVLAPCLHLHDHSAALQERSGSVLSTCVLLFPAAETGF
uniref:Zgc:162592 n=2 Tax=Latimeria chalumnae TaxID=7897 RepID=H3AVE5_LATCH|nr:PREDICTED: probable G-protein coupled receptor 21 [Latimeria chalumnae]|eukprot:XP_006002161.1 PREDICTED: probable G-protein coupled receptor 21 [Latimeria chalumnae]